MIILLKVIEIKQKLKNSLINIQSFKIEIQ